MSRLAAPTAKPQDSGSPRVLPLLRFSVRWNEADRAKYDVIRDRYSTDMSDAEFELVSALLPPPKVRGRKPTDVRTILNALFYMIRAGCPWRLLPKDFPPFTPVQNRFYAWRDSRLWMQIISVLVMAAREDEGRQAAPTAVVVDSQSVKTTEAGGPRGFDAGKKIKGAQATYRRRYARIADRMPSHTRKCPRSRRPRAHARRGASQEPMGDNVLRR